MLASPIDKSIDEEGLGQEQEIWKKKVRRREMRGKVKKLKRRKATKEGPRWGESHRRSIRKRKTKSIRGRTARTIVGARTA